jgi:hypothetical protein
MTGNIKRIVGAGLGGIRGDSMSLNQTENYARKTTKGYVGAKALTLIGAYDYGKKFANRQKRKKPIHKKPDVKTWEDRNRANQGTKLNP